MSATVVLILRLALVLLLYIFLGWALYTLWRDLQEQAFSLSSRAIPTLSLAVIHADQVDLHNFTTPEVLIGRDPACDLHLPNETVSSHHARLAYHHNQWWLEDLQSTNGTFINETQVTTQTVVISGDELRLGKALIGVTISNPKATR